MFLFLALRLTGNSLTKVERTIEIGKNMPKNGMEPEGYQNVTKTEPKRAQIQTLSVVQRNYVSCGIELLIGFVIMSLVLKLREIPYEKRAR